MAEVVSCRLVAWMQSKAILYGMLVTMWQWDRFFPEYLSFILSAFVHARDKFIELLC